LATQSVTHHTPAYPFSFFTLGVSSLTLLKAWLAGNGHSIGKNHNTEQGRAGSTEGDLLDGRVNSHMRTPAERTYPPEIRPASLSRDPELFSSEKNFNVLVRSKVCCDALLKTL